MHTNTLKEFHFEVLCIAVVSVAAAYKALPRDQCCSNDSGIETVVSRCMDSYSNPSLSHWKSVVCCPTTRSSHYRGAALTLVWNISAYLIISYCFQNANKYVRNAFMASVLLYPIAGWLADVYLGRYRVIRCSLWIMWTATVVHGAVWALKAYIPHYHIIKNIVYGAGFIGLSGFQANIAQFGLDQLRDASPSAISSYISWNVWCYYLSGSLVFLSQTCHCKIYSDQLFFLLFPLSLTLSLVLDICFSKCLIEELLVQNPLRLIFLVLRYAVKHKHPQLRSAFWEDQPQSRISLAKIKHGGPFTSDQVEDVKYFFRILVVVAAASFFMGMANVQNHTYVESVFNYSENSTAGNCSAESVNEFMQSCYKLQLVKYFPKLFMVIYIPLSECVLCPVLAKCLSVGRLRLMQRFLVAMLLHVLYMLYVVTVEVVHALSQSQSFTCLLVAIGPRLVPSAYFKWLVPARLFFTCTMYLLFTSAVEFLCAQSPYTMKGLLVGIVYVTFILSVLLSFSWRLMVEGLLKMSTAGIVQHTCGLWYFLSVLVIEVVLVCIVCAIMRWYSFRRRDGSEDSQQIVTVNHYNSSSE